MPLLTNNVAVLIFALPSRMEAARKVLTPSGRSGLRRQRSEALWATMGQLTAAKVQAAGLSHLQSTSLLSADDYARPFGEQLQLAVSAVLQRGYEQVIVIGNDCPDLRVNDLRAAVNALRQGHMPIGHDQRGGVYLFGVDRRFIATDYRVGEPRNTGNYADLFKQLPWQTAQLSEALSEFLVASFGSVRGLTSVRVDWNERADLRAGIWLKGAFRYIAHRVWSLVAPVIAVFESLSFSSFSVNRVTSGLRAPPTSAPSGPSRYGEPFRLAY